ncbi:DegT/DnrJ/EryC1/StrS family aminotransferase [Agilicoccus flavus]|uniref:DegT/DnrJ/EryC1/StrS family aminotransferase n=1 Tax=Agilicoccus flavus TaxID=2775968 RepID=UPI001CF6ECDB|nr:DegT/DnrJ/EryC1/StrS family aminotransferase [Agilicoccus flavus]
MTVSDPRPEFVPFAPPDIGEAEIEAAVEAMRSGWLTTGPRAASFEREFAAVLGTDLRDEPDPTVLDSAAEGPGGRVHAVALNSATAGLHLALEAVGVGPGDEVIVPTWTFTATAEVVRYLGARPVIVDVDRVTLNLDLDAARAAVTSATRAVIPVHFAGLPVDRGALAAFAREAGVAVVEDAAHAFPAMSSGQPVGVGESEAVVFSFYATKTMTTGEGGMAVTAHEDLAARMRTMRLHGISKDVFARYAGGYDAGGPRVPRWAYEVIAPGFKYNLTDPAAAMGRVQLRRAVAMRRSREAIAARYDEAFSDLPLDLPPRGGPGDVHARHLYVVRLRDDAPMGRDAFVDALTELGIGTSLHFIPLHRHPYWADGFARGPYPVADDAFGRVVSLPIPSGLRPDHLDRVVDAVRQVLS